MLLNTRAAPICTLFIFLSAALLTPQIIEAYPFEEDTLVLELWTELEPVVSVPDEEKSGGADSGEGAGTQSAAQQSEQTTNESSEDSYSSSRSGEDDFVDNRTSGPLDRKEAVRRVLEEARIVLSAMLYGFEVRYTPPDTEREVEEYFKVDPVAKIKEGDPRLRTLDTRTSEGRFYVRFRYNMAEHQIRRRSAWESNTIPSVTAEGTTPLYKGYRGKFDSFEEAIKQGLRAYLRPREYNKPREIVATVLFRDPPRTWITAGGYHSKVSMKLRIEEVLPYGAY